MKAPLPPNEAARIHALHQYAILDTTEERAFDDIAKLASFICEAPITAIRGSLGLLHAGTAGVLPEVAAKLVGIAESSCERLVLLLNDILDMEKIEAGKLELRLSECDLVQLASQAQTAMQGYAAERGVVLRLDHATGNARTLADPDRVIQVLTNLISNAVRFSPAGGTVELSVAAAEGSHRVCVRDHGPGMAAAGGAG